jgi:UDP-N-acetylglucosamine--N-acetylmuramyl-(pentapeptide) pyrophosphoryl-undecaprenol N-acetylglucosamine transferase
MALVNNKAAWMVKDNDVNSALVGRLKDLMKDSAVQQEMTENLKRMAVTDADEHIAARVLEIAKANR